LDQRDADLITKVTSGAFLSLGFDKADEFASRGGGREEDDDGVEVRE
jgi:hypothetical protein